ncbi:MAG: lyase family protein, partial [Alphaproteobacteria bacterium]|nr:lyase family protein [Alphaproteobacteria bacterium]
IRHLQRSDVREAEEYFSPGQKGSSAMPHKRNPVLSENLTGQARLIRASVIPAMENVALWHERDISHSSVERVAAPDATILADFALNRLAGIIENLIVYPARMKENMESLKGLTFSQSVLLELAQKGMSREDAYKIVQHHAMRVWEGEGSFQELLEKDKDLVAVLPADELQAIFNYNRFVQRVGDIIDSALY